MGLLIFSFIGTCIASLNDELCGLSKKKQEADKKLYDFCLTSYYHDRDVAFQVYIDGSLVLMLKNAANEGHTQLNVDGHEFLKAIEGLLPSDRIWKDSGFQIHPWEFQDFWNRGPNKNIHMEAWGASKLVFKWCSTSSARTAP